MRCWLGLALAVAGPAGAQVLSVELHAPARDFGYFAGDLLTTTAVIGLASGTALDTGSLPQPGPVAAALDVRSVAVEQSPNGAGTRLEVSVTYQNFVSPEQVSQALVPGYTLAFRRAGARLTASVPGFAYAVSTFRHDLQPVLDPAALRPDHAAARPSLALPAWLLAIGCGVAALAAAALLADGGWAAFGKDGRPFALAARDLARGEAPQADAMLALHRAFDATARRRVFADDLDGFLARHPRFRPLEDEIAAFFAASRTVFFGSGEALGGAASGSEGPLSRQALTRLSRKLARAERRP